jgi:hypothetical protein
MHGKGGVVPGTVEITTLKALTPDPMNPREHTERNASMLDRSIEEVGLARSVVVDEAGRILAGNQTTEAAAARGIERVIVVEVSGNELVAVRRRNLTDEQKIRLALYDNRAGELAGWKPEVVREIGTVTPLERFWTEKELEHVLKPLASGEAGGESGGLSLQSSTVHLSYDVSREGAEIIRKAVGKVQKEAGCSPGTALEQVCSRFLAAETE